MNKVMYILGDSLFIQVVSGVNVSQIESLLCFLG